MTPVRQTPTEDHREIDSGARHQQEQAATARSDMPIPMPPLKLLRFTAVRERTGLSRSTIWRLERRGAFPRHRVISTNVVAWVEDELVAWIRAKVDAAV
jgi:prophage regulatory protein